MTRDSELRELLNAFGETGADKGIFTNRDIAHLAASGHKILSMRSVEGLEVDAKETLTEISAKVIVNED
jgi:hypothetical protein